MIVALNWISQDAVGRLAGGGRGIRTPGALSGTTVFKTAGINRSPIPPRQEGYPVSLVYSTFNHIRIEPGFPSRQRPISPLVIYFRCHLYFQFQFKEASSILSKQDCARSPPTRSFNSFAKHLTRPCVQEISSWSSGPQTKSCRALLQLKLAKLRNKLAYSFKSTLFAPVRERLRSDLLGRARCD